MPSELKGDWRQAEQAAARYSSTGDLAALDLSIAAWERILRSPEFEKAPQRFRATVKKADERFEAHLERLKGEERR